MTLSYFCDELTQAKQVLLCEIDLSNHIPDGDAIGRSQNILVQNGWKKLFSRILEILREKGLILKKGTIVYPTIIAAPTSAKNKEKKRDPQAHSVKKGSTWHFGYKAHIGVDSKTGLVLRSKPRLRMCTT